MQDSLSVDIPPSSVRSLFEQAGWFPGRRVRISARVPSDHSARAVLSSFAGLRVGKSGPGLECSASDILFGDRDSEIDVEARWGSCLGVQLICVGAHHNEHGETFIDSRGRVFGASLMHDAFWFAGDSVWSGIESVLRGRRSRPVLHPSQDRVTMYGENYERGDPRLILP